MVSPRPSGLPISHPLLSSVSWSPSERSWMPVVEHSSSMRWSACCRRSQNIAITAADAAGRYENEMSILDAGYENEDMKRWYWILTYDEIYSWIGSSINKVSLFFRPTDTPSRARWCGDEVSVVAWKPWMPPWAPAILGDGDKDGANEGDIYIIVMIGIYWD